MAGSASLTSIFSWEAFLLKTCCCCSCWLMVFDGSFLPNLILFGTGTLTRKQQNFVCPSPSTPNPNSSQTQTHRLDSPKSTTSSTMPRKRTTKAEGVHDQRAIEPKKRGRPPKKPKTTSNHPEVPPTRNPPPVPGKRPSIPTRHSRLGH